MFTPVFHIRTVADINVTERSVSVITRTAQHCIFTIDFLREQNSVSVEWQECIFALIKFFEVECISDSDSWSMITITPCNPVTVFNPGNARIVFIFRFDHISITSLELNRFMVYFPIYTILAESCKNVHLYSFVVATENSCKSVFIATRKPPTSPRTRSLTGSWTSWAGHPRIS